MSRQAIQSDICLNTMMIGSGVIGSFRTTWSLLLPATWCWWAAACDGARCRSRSRRSSLPRRGSTDCGEDQLVSASTGQLLMGVVAFRQQRPKLASHTIFILLLLSYQYLRQGEWGEWENERSGRVTVGEWQWSDSGVTVGEWRKWRKWVDGRMRNMKDHWRMSPLAAMEAARAYLVDFSTLRRY